MSFVEIDSFDAVAPWQVLDGLAAPSAEIALTALPDTGHPLARANGALRADFSALSDQHRMRRAIPATDLGTFDRLCFWFRPDRALSGAPEDAFRLRVRIGSVARPLDAAGNLWCRYLVGSNGTGWNYAVMSLADLPPAIGAAATAIEFQVISPLGAAASVQFDALALARPEMVADVDAALVARLGNQLVLNGNPVPATLMPAVLPQPYIAIAQWGQLRAWGRDPVGMRRRERDDQGLILGTAPEAHDLEYRLEIHAGTRGEQAAILDFQQQRLGSGWLPLGNRAWRIDKIDTPALGDEALPLPPLRYLIAAYAETAATTRAFPVEDMQMTLDAQAGG